VFPGRDNRRASLLTICARLWPLGCLLAGYLSWSGCATNPATAAAQAQAAQQQAALSRQIEEYQTRSNALDRDNQQLQQLLAQAYQKNKLLEDQVGLLQKQLGDMNNQIARLQQEKLEQEKRVQTLTASLQRSGSVTIQPNNSLLQTLPAINISGVQVRRDNDVIRVELPADQLFETGSFQFRPGAVQMITSVAAEIARLYPEQIIGVEGFTDTDPIPAGPWRNHTQMSISWAAAVHDVLVTQTALRLEQLFVVGHGSAYPVMSNGTAAGRARNRRVELVIYPEKYSSSSRS
jgi:flagellar motor protein MotB